MSDLPSGTVTFLFTDIQGSTALWEQDRQAMQAAVDRHLRLLGNAINVHGGVLFKVIGDAVQAAFPTAQAALQAAAAAQQALVAEPWSERTGPLRVRMALHTGEAAPRDGDYLAPALNRLARLLAAGHGGQILMSNATRGLVAGGALNALTLRDLGEHRLRDLLEPERVWQVLAPGLPDAFPPLVTLSAELTNLPSQPTALIGREREVAEVGDLLRLEQTRLVTLTGPGGTGKTRLALQIAAEMLEKAPDGVYFVDLSSVTEAVHVYSAIAAVLALHEAGSSSLRDTLVDYLAPKAIVLVLDNLEQIRPADEAGRLIADLLAACPNLRVLATSRSPLKIRAEREYPVPPLPPPAADRARSWEELAENPAIQLFVERARAARPTFALTADNAEAVAAICQRLDGLPLAIELAAARIRVLAPAELERRLGNQLGLLTGATADRPDRQQTLRATIAWSYDLLSAEEQALFRRLSVFAGGCTLETAEAITADVDPIPVDVLDGITSLLEQSLLRAEETLEMTRYRMLETLRAFGQEQLRQAGEEETARSTHARIILAEMQRGTAGLRGADPARWAETLEAEHDNLRAALTWATGMQTQPMGVALAAASWSFWEIRGYLSEGRMWLDQALALPAVAPSRERAEALAGMSVLAMRQGDLEAAAAAAEESLRRWRALADRTGEGRSLRALGVVADLRGEEPRALALFQQSLDLARQEGDEMGIAAALNSLGVVLWNTGQIPEARAALEESLAIGRRLGHRARLALPLNNLALIAIDAGDLTRGRAYLEESLVIDQELGRKAGIADTLENLGAIAVEEENLAQAARLYAESLRLRQELADRVSVAYSLESIAGTAAAAGDCAAAARLFGAAAALRADTGSPLPESELGRYEGAVAQARSSLSEPDFAAAWEAGRALSWREAADLALEVAASTAARESTQD